MFVTAFVICDENSRFLQPENDKKTIGGIFP